MNNKTERASKQSQPGGATEIPIYSFEVKRALPQPMERVDGTGKVEEEHEPTRRKGLSALPVPSPDAECSRSDESRKVLLQRRCLGLQLSTSSLAPGPGSFWVGQLSHRKEASEFKSGREIIKDECVEILHDGSPCNVQWIFKRVKPWSIDHLK